ncbi:MAG: hypothetical protein LBQ65_02290 [Tannerellaceae bacterium]|jgi:hypothetical protein|nr:hypothetical protein [Tannerellaceae bacterium]
MAKRFELKAKQIMLLMALVISASVMAQEGSKLEITPSADLVSSYVWRGAYQTATAVQPGLTLSYGGFSLGAWGSTDFSFQGKEVDFTVGYEAGGFSIAFTDYWWAGEGSSYTDYAGNHFLEGSIGFSFGEAVPLSLSWNTMLGLDSDKNGEEKQQYSTYVSASYDFSVKDVALTASIGVAPWTGIYHKADTEGFVVSAISLKATKELKITDSFSLPIFAETIIAPNQDNVFLVFGISL